MKLPRASIVIFVTILSSFEATAQQALVHTQSFYGAQTEKAEMDSKELDSTTVTVELVGHKSEEDVGGSFTNATGDYVFDPETRSQMAVSDCNPDGVFHPLMIDDCKEVCPKAGSREPMCKNIKRMRLLYCTCPKNKLSQNCQLASSMKVDDCDTRAAFSKNQCMKACKMTGQGRTAYQCTPNKSAGPSPKFCVCAK